MSVVIYRTTKIFWFLYYKTILWIVTKIIKNFIGRLSGNENLLIIEFIKKPLPQNLMYKMLYVAGIKFDDIMTY